MKSVPKVSLSFARIYYEECIKRGVCGVVVVIGSIQFIQETNCWDV
jgi:3-isopropylmalate dehydratase small subunit